MGVPELKNNLRITNVLVPTDFFPCSHQALLHALMIAKYYASAVTLLHVIQAHQEGVLQEAWRNIRKLETDLVEEGYLQGVSHRLLDPV